MTDLDLSLLSDEEAYEALQLLEQAERLARHEWELTKRQKVAYELADEVDELFFGGAAGGGKTDLALYRAYHKSVQIPNHRTLVIRNSFPELRRTWIPRSRQRFKSTDDVEAVWRAADREWHFSNGSIIEFGYVDGDQTVFQYDSAEYQMLIVDEATQFHWDEIQFLIGRLRATRQQRADGARPHTLLLSNPGGPGHMDFRNMFVLPTNYGRKVATVELIPGDKQSRRRRAFVPSKVSDNPHLDEDYVRNLKQLPEKLRKQRLDGDWDTYDGQFFEEFSAQVHVVEPFRLPDQWRRARCYDYGYAAPAVCLWLAFGYGGEIIVYREWSGTKLTIDEQAREILNADRGERIDFSVADPSIWRADTKGKRISARFKKAGIQMVKGDNERVAGWMTLRELLRPRTEADDPLFEGIPRLTIFSSCKDLIRTFPEAQHDKKNSDDLVLRDDHWLDALRYGCQHARSRPMLRKPLAAKLPDDPGSRRAALEIRGYDSPRVAQHPDLGAI